MIYMCEWVRWHPFTNISPFPAQAPQGEIHREQIEDLCDGCISLSNAEGLYLLQKNPIDTNKNLCYTYVVVHR